MKLQDAVKMHVAKGGMANELMESFDIHTHFICDKCQKPLPPLEEQQMGWYRVETLPGIHIDLCPDCQDPAQHLAAQAQARRIVKTRLWRKAAEIEHLMRVIIPREIGSVRIQADYLINLIDERLPAGSLDEDTIKSLKKLINKSLRFAEGKEAPHGHKGYANSDNS